MKNLGQFMQYSLQKLLILIPSFFLLFTACKSQIPEVSKQNPKDQALNKNEKAPSDTTEEIIKEELDDWNDNFLPEPIPPALKQE